jgi:phage I-like protein
MKEQSSTGSDAKWSRKKALSTQVSAEVLDEVRSCVVALSGPPDRLTISSLVEQALRQEIQRLRIRKNRGEPFSAKHEGLRTGRPVGS